MSLGIAFKGPEGIVLAADSRVTLFAEREVLGSGQVHLLPSSFDNARKLLQFKSHSYVGAVTYGLGALGQDQPRTAHSFLPEFDDELQEELKAQDKRRLSTKQFAQKLSDFFLRQWEKAKMPNAAEYRGEPMIFLVGGYDEGEPYGSVFDFVIPNRPQPVEQNSDTFGVIWGGQSEVVHRLLNGFDDRLPEAVEPYIDKGEMSLEELTVSLKQKLSQPIPYQFLSLQDSVDFSVFLIRSTIDLQRFQVGVRGVGGDIDVAIITRVNGFQSVRQKVVQVRQNDYSGVGEGWD